MANALSTITIYRLASSGLYLVTSVCGLTDLVWSTVTTRPWPSYITHEHIT